MIKQSAEQAISTVVEPPTEVSDPPTVESARPFLKWPGGKRWLLPALTSLRPPKFARYHEVCLGGGAQFFGLRSNGFAGPAFLYDFNAELIRTYAAVKRSPAAVIQSFATHAACHCESYFMEVRALTPADLTESETAARMLYLNKAAFNGLYRVNRQGQANIPWGKRDSVAIDEQNVFNASVALRNARLIQGDFGSVLDSARAGDFVFLDPPYPDGFTAYTSMGFGASDHHRLHDVCCELNRRNVAFVQSNADCPFVRQLYGDFHIVGLSANRNINRKGDGRGPVGEVVIMNY